MTVYLVGGTTPRADLDNYVGAFLTREDAEICKAWWEKEQGNDDFHIDSIDVFETADGLYMYDMDYLTEENR